MNKPREEMSEEERKLVKEFEKKVATFKVTFISTEKKGCKKLKYIL
jgi:hypothetical protein